MPAAEREQFILNQAIRFFAERGFEGQTRELAKRMGLTHATIYRHFPSKEALVERVYEHIYLSRWNPEWGPLIRNRSIPLDARLSQFYLEYVERVFDYNWVRIFVSSGLKSFDITKRYLAIVKREIIEPACLELRHDLHLPPVEVVPLSEREIETFWGLHGRIFYMAIRRFVYCTPTPSHLDDIVRDSVTSFLSGAKELMPRIVAESGKTTASAKSALAAPVEAQ
ncbi:MAG: TetR/AcrR family transcriptional regulator [Xanthobacteraceae bacterium]|nr:TetR/AcrR family transcriptional regulator [Xanthobacteraceae bacterium]